MFYTEPMFTKDSVHHAYIIYGDRERIVSEVCDLLKEELGIVRQGNPDFFYEEFSHFGIDDSRKIQGMQNYRGFSGSRKIFLFCVDSMNHEAQNALLKVFEEPTEGTHFFIITSSLERFLPTLLSRVVVIRHSSVDAQNEDFDAKVVSFLQAPYSVRLEAMKSIIDAKDKVKAQLFVERLIALVHRRKLFLDRHDIYETLVRFQSFLRDRSSSLKLILEHIALMMPRL